MNKIKVLINAYACSPNMGSEPGMAWNWCVNLAKYCELHIITEGEFKDKIESDLPNLSHGNNMHFYYNPLSEEIRKMCWNQGDWRFYKHYKKWQYKTYELAKKIVKNEDIQILHQLNMIGFREPGYLWKIQDIPFVWGPVDAKEKFPVSYLNGASVKTKAFTHLKNSITKLQLKYSNRVSKAVNSANVVVAASSNSQQAFKKFFNIDSPLINETGCYIQEHPVLNKIDKDGLDLLWVGKLDFRKQLGVAIQTLVKLKDIPVKLHVVGGGDSIFYKEMARKLEVADAVKWYGLITHKEVQQIMQKSDLFFFTSVAEGTPHVVLEAISNNLPVLCMDTCGQGDSVNDNVGIKVELSTPNDAIEAFATNIRYLYNNKEVLYRMAQNCKNRQKELSWDEKAKKMLALYKECIIEKKS